MLLLNAFCKRTRAKLLHVLVDPFNTRRGQRGFHYGLADGRALSRAGYNLEARRRLLAS